MQPGARHRTGKRTEFEETLAWPSGRERRNPRHTDSASRGPAIVAWALRALGSLGFDSAAERYGLDPDAVLTSRSGPWIPLADPKAQPGPLTGIWLSSYEYESTGREGPFTSQHYVAVVQHGARLQVRSMPGSQSRVIMDLTANGQVLTGMWTEETNPSGYYHGAVYHGAIQLLLEPTGRRMTGKWVGFGRDFDLNTGPWSLELVTSSVTDETMKEYSRPVAAD